MPPIKSSQKTTGAPGVKLLITAASLAAALGGWALLSADEVQPTVQPQASASNTTSQQAATPALKVKLAPLPTLVPLVPQSRVVTINNSVAPASAARPATQPAAPAQPALRVVNAPPQQQAAGRSTSSSAPAPVTSTRSSR